MIVKEKEILHIDTLVECAVEHIPNVWSMKSFIHHNPLHGFENMHFEDALDKAHKLFHAKKSLSREAYQHFYKEGKITQSHLDEEISDFLERYEHKHPLLKELIGTLMKNSTECYLMDSLSKSSQTIINISKKLSAEAVPNPENFHTDFVKLIAKEKTIYDVVDAIFATDIGESLNDIMSQIAMRFFGEGQAILNMPKREKGLFLAWKEIVMQDRVFFKEDLRICRLLRETYLAEDIIYVVLKELKIPRSFWEDYFTLELTKQHGWSGFLKHRVTSTSEYQQKYPAYMEEFLAIRLYYSYMLLNKHITTIGFFPSMKELATYIINEKEEVLLRYEYNNGKLLLNYFESVEELLHSKNIDAKISYDKYIYDKKDYNYKLVAEYLYKTLTLFLDETEIENLSSEDINQIEKALRDLKEQEGFIWLKAMEKSYMMQLMGDYAHKLTLTNEIKTSSEAQLLFCIDTRSERIRRQIERTGSYETFGIAGFFGIPFKSIDVTNRCESNLCPAVINPKNIVYSFHEKESINSKGLMKTIKKVINELKYNVLTPYVTVEAIGSLFAFDLFGKTLWPELHLPFKKRIFEPKVTEEFIVEKYTEKEATEIITLIQNQIIRYVAEELFKLKPALIDEELVDEIREIALSKEDIIPEDQDGVTINPVTQFGIKYKLMQIEEQSFIDKLRVEYKISAGHMRIQKAKMAKVGFSFKEQIFYVKNAFNTIGLDSFSNLVLFCAHESQSENNPYESALDCGACGGQSGLLNAKVLAYMANKPTVREELKKHGIHIPDQTYFLAALHNTTSDTIEIFDKTLPDSHQEAISELKSNLLKASMKTAMERAHTLPLADTRSLKSAFKFTKRNTIDWSQPRPEWGLSQNHSFIIGKRVNSKYMNLQGRTFLQSYDYKSDKKAAILTSILSGALVVGEWINLEHFFSTVDNKAFGSESKVYHNVVGKIGVISGNMSDLRTGLPSQTVNIEERPFHEPLRLITMIEAPLEMAKECIKNIHKVNELVYHEWIRTIIVDEKQEAFFFYEKKIDEWKKIAFNKFMKEEQNR